MHMADALISPVVGGVMTAVSVGAISYSVRKVQRNLDEKKVPVMGVMGAFVFASQMINFTIPATGSSGHIGGGIMLAALLGGNAGLLVMTAVLALQALFFADGGLLALGCNVFNIGVIPCLLIYPLLYKRITTKRLTPKRITAASVISVVVGLQLGAFAVVLETLLSGRTELPFSAFLLLMQPIHLAIGIAEGLITAAVLCFIYSASPELLEGNALAEGQKGRFSRKRILVVLVVLTVAIGGLVSGFASAFPDGLEWAIDKVAGGELENPENGIYAGLESVQERTAVLPDYALADNDKISERAQTGIAGVIGSCLVLVIAAGAGVVIKMVKRKNTCQD